MTGARENILNFDSSWLEASKAGCDWMKRERTENELVEPNGNHTCDLGVMLHKKSVFLTELLLRFSSKADYDKRVRVSSLDSIIQFN